MKVRISTTISIMDRRLGVSRFSAVSVEIWRQTLRNYDLTWLTQFALKILYLLDT